MKPSVPKQCLSAAFIVGALCSLAIPLSHARADDLLDPSPEQMPGFEVEGSLGAALGPGPFTALRIGVYLDPHVVLGIGAGLWYQSSNAGLANLEQGYLAVPVHVRIYLADLAPETFTGFVRPTAAYTTQLWGGSAVGASGMARHSVSAGLGLGLIYMLNSDLGLSAEVQPGASFGFDPERDEETVQFAFQSSLGLVFRVP